MITGMYYWFNLLIRSYWLLYLFSLNGNFISPVLLVALSIRSFLLVTLPIRRTCYLSSITGLMVSMIVLIAVDLGSSPGLVKPTTMKLAFVDFGLIMQHWREIAKLVTLSTRSYWLLYLQGHTVYFTYKVILFTLSTRSYWLLCLQGHTNSVDYMVILVSLPTRSYWFLCLEGFTGYFAYMLILVTVPIMSYLLLCL